MKRIFFFGVLFFVKTAVAQTESKRIDQNPFFEVLLDKEEATSTPAGFSSVLVLDARPDTSEIGFYSIGSLEKEWPRKYSMMPSVAQAIKDWVSAYWKLPQVATDTTAYTLLIVLKKYWVSAEATARVFEQGNKAQQNQGFDPGIVTKLEFYSGKNNQYCPLYRIDTVFSIEGKLPGDAGNFVVTAMKKSLEKLSAIDMNELWNRKRKISFEEVKNYAVKIRRFPVFTDTVFKKGVYRNFEAFKMNTASIVDFEVKKSELGDMLFVKEDGVESPERKMWGYCDGTNIYINSGDKYSKLMRRANMFYFGGTKGITRTAKHDLPYTSVGNLIWNNGRKYTSFTRVIKYYMVDMDNGEVY